MDEQQIVGIRDVIPPPIPQAFNDVYIGTELMDTDLHHIIRSNQELSEEHCQVCRNNKSDQSMASPSHQPRLVIQNLGA